MQTFKQYINEEDESAETWGYKNALIKGNGLFWGNHYRMVGDSLRLKYEDWFYYHYKNSKDNLDIIRNWLNTNSIFFTSIVGVWSNDFVIDNKFLKEPSNFLTEQEAKIVVELMMGFFQEEVI